MADKKQGLFNFLKKKSSGDNGYDDSANKAIPKSKSMLLDMLNGGGAGMEGPRFEGGPISGLLNTIGIKPLGYYDRAANYKAPLTEGQASRQAVSSSTPEEDNSNAALETQLARRANLGPFDPRVSTGQVDWGNNAFGPLSAMSGPPQVDPTAPEMPQPDLSGMSTEEIGTILAGGTAAVAGNAALRAALMYELSRRGAGGMPPVARPQPLMIAQRPIPYTPPTSSVVPRGGMRVGAPAFTGGSMNLRPSTGGGGAGMFSIDGRMPPQFLE
tara:strand:- start:7 stop:819 length:813 start_codon:yes stop_codon:yes gene_type:complete